MKSEIITTLNSIKDLLKKGVKQRDIADMSSYIDEAISNIEVLEVFAQASRMTFVPEYEDFVWMVDLESSSLVHEMEWKSYDWQIKLLLNGGIFLTERAAKAAAIRARKALWDAKFEGEYL